jgi:integrase
MKMKFNPKQYQGKARVYPQVAGAPGIRRLWIWNEKRQEYLSPQRGKPFEARRYEVTGDGKRSRTKQAFETLQAARSWQSFSSKEAVTSTLVDVEKTTGPSFGDIVNEFRRTKYPQLAESTRVAYDKLIKLYLESLLSLPIREVTPKRIDRWLAELKRPDGKAMQSSRRFSFDHELSLLSTILKYYVSYHDDASFQFPVKQRHQEVCGLNRRRIAKSKDLTEAEFQKFRSELLKLSHGAVLATLATVQYYQALRISEVAALYWEDVIFDFGSPEESKLRIVRSVCWPRRRGQASFVQAGFKNGESNNGIKVQPLFKESFKGLEAEYRPEKTGLVFNQDGVHFEYRQIQHAYDTAFRSAGLPYTGTHVMRHGGCRRVYNKAPDLEVAKQLLGNSSPLTALVYAKREASALTKVAKSEWDDEEREAGRNWSQNQRNG